MRTAMPTNSTLFLTTAFVRDQPSRFMLSLWNRLRARLSPEFDCLVVDGASPIALPLPGFTFSTADDEMARMASPLHCVAFPGPDTLGPPKSRADGSPDSFLRAFKLGATIALREGYRRVFFVVSDTLLVKPAGPIVERCATHRITAATPWGAMYQWPETDILFADAQWLCSMLGRIDWRAPPAQFWELAFEARCPDLFILPMRGTRNDLGQITAANLDQAFPHGCDYLTHCRDFAVYRRLLAMNGLEDVWDG